MKQVKGTTAAIVAAVAAYLEEEQATRAPRPVRAAPVFSLWGSAGRQEAMHMRTLWQLRIVPLGRVK